jgi:hypothetical protein
MFIVVFELMKTDPGSNAINIYSSVYVLSKYNKIVLLDGKSSLSYLISTISENVLKLNTIRFSQTTNAYHWNRDNENNTIFTI